MNAAEARLSPDGPACSIEGCGRPRDARGWCTGHWRRWRRWGDPLSDVPLGQFHQPRPRRCTVRGCERRPYARTMCRGHVARWYRWGDPRPELPLGHSRRPVRRWPAVALLDYVETHAELARLLGRARMAESKWGAVLLTTAKADDAAMALGLHPGSVWPDWFGSISAQAHYARVAV